MYDNNYASVLLISYRIVIFFLCRCGIIANPSCCSCGDVILYTAPKNLFVTNSSRLEVDPPPLLLALLGIRTTLCMKHFTSMTFATRSWGSYRYWWMKWRIERIYHKCYIACYYLRNCIVILIFCIGCLVGIGMQLLYPKLVHNTYNGLGTYIAVWLYCVILIIII